MKLEEGKMYQTRNPELRPVRVTRRQDYYGIYPWIGDNGQTYTSSGQFRAWTGSEFDLVAEVPAEVPKLQLEDGKVYQTRNPKYGPVKIEWVGGGNYPWKGKSLLYAKDGRHLIGEDGPRDLVAEIQQEPTLDKRVAALEREVVELRKELPVQLSPEQRKALEDGEKLVAIEKSRAGFDAWATKEKMDLRRTSAGDYMHAYTQHSWRGWIAAEGLV